MDMMIYWDGPTILDNGRVQVIVVGYNHKMRLLLDTIIGKIMHFEVKADRFDVIKETSSQRKRSLLSITLKMFYFMVRSHRDVKKEK
ncbi:Zinc-metallopeptidase, peroxisomal [Acorus calamus]|uniref:Zinc-metallopeptidase, peroxisomal n=1 Tax=Acorus calamus TaxID=4465 RepID=A0AAV9CYM1_ACOCL|nr:Zinc-metallopeptidase, peroxisomal [Acorus calamus]